MVAHERLTEQRATIDWLLAKPRSFKNLPPILDLNGTSENKMEETFYSCPKLYSIFVKRKKVWIIRLDRVWNKHFLKIGILVRIYVPFLRSAEVFGQLGEDETWKFLRLAKIGLIIAECGWTEKWVFCKYSK